MEQVSLKIDKFGSSHIVWNSEKDGILTIKYSFLKNNEWHHYGTIYSSESKIYLHESSFVVDPFPMVAFIEQGGACQMVIMRLDGEVWFHDVFDLSASALWVGIANYKVDYNLPICSSSSSSSSDNSSSSSLQSIFGDDSSYKNELSEGAFSTYVFTIETKGKAQCYVYKQDIGELEPFSVYSTASLEGNISNINSVVCGDYFGITHVVKDKIHYNFFSFIKNLWSFGNFPTFVHSAPYGDPIGKSVFHSTNGYGFDHIGNMPLVWVSKDDFGGLIMRGSIITTNRQEWPLDFKDHVIATVSNVNFKKFIWDNVTLVKNSKIPQIFVFGSKIRKLWLVKEGVWDAEDLSVDGWIGYVKNRKSTACLWNNVIHVVFRDDSGLYYFSDHEKKIHKLSD